MRAAASGGTWRRERAGAGSRVAPVFRAIAASDPPACTRLMIAVTSGDSGLVPGAASGGLPGLTLGGCPSVFTMFWQGYISSVGCVPLVVSPLPHGRPVHISLSASGRPCTTS